MGKFATVGLKSNDICIRKDQPTAEVNYSLNRASEP
ncbi:hypothetical protein Bhyg_00508 [Pseudolycoriella hygida]|uniref:Uncharacterized protein n=1 Tax=Pseudolycoriella hygida TaxID=35572 RepID=A0A9Q0N9T2_9DIPT|nr:hypothetical protein Bhyg_00508 [Pseudolycoriella hygida]